MSWTGRTRCRRTARLDVKDADGAIHGLSVWVTDHEHEKADGFSCWRKHRVDYQLQDGRFVRALDYNTFEGVGCGDRFTTVR